MVKTILFVCKFNLFRSKVAETYFNRMNKNKDFCAESAGIIEVTRPLSEGEKERNRYIKQEYGLSFNPQSRTVTYDLLNSADQIIIVAEDVPKKALEHHRWSNKIMAWKIPDEHTGDKRNVNKSLKPLIRKLDLFISKLNKKIK